jgi:type II secretory ATPase GspE/PulE/Tfp pilus assembly ATPase PilB-like protein
VLLTGPCNSGKSTATYRALSLLRDEGRKIFTVEWPMEWKLDGVAQYNLHDLRDPYAMVGPCLRRAIRRNPDVLMLQNIDWVNDADAEAAIAYAAAGGLLITAIHIRDCASGLVNMINRHFWNRRQEMAALFKMVVAPRRLFMVCMYCAEEVRVPAKILVEAGMSDPPTGADGHVATWRGRGCPHCENTGELGSTAIYEVLELNGEMKRFIENSNDWNYDQIEYLERQAWLHGMRTQREIALERVLAGDISLQAALLNTTKPRWLAAAQAARRRGQEKEAR